MAIIVHIKLINTPIEIRNFANLGKKQEKQLDSGRKLVLRKNLWMNFYRYYLLLFASPPLSCVSHIFCNLQFNIY